RRCRTDRPASGWCCCRSTTRCRNARDELGPSSPYRLEEHASVQKRRCAGNGIRRVPSGRRRKRSVVHRRFIHPTGTCAWHGLLEVHAHVLRQLDLQMRAAHGLTLSQSEVLIFLDDAPDQRVRMAQLAKGVLLSSSGGTRLVERLETLGYVTRRAAADDRRGLFAELTDAGRHVVMAVRASYREGVRASF